MQRTVESNFVTDDDHVRMTDAWSWKKLLSVASTFLPCSTGIGPWASDGSFFCRQWRCCPELHLRRKTPNACGHQSWEIQFQKDSSNEPPSLGEEKMLSLKAERERITHPRPALPAATFPTKSFSELLMKYVALSWSDCPFNCSP